MDDSFVYGKLRQEKKAILNGHTNGIKTVQFSPDGFTLASGSMDNSIRLWNVKKYK